MTDERIEIGADVVGKDGEKAGTVAYIVVRPPELEVTDFVVSTGSFLGRDLVVPVSEVERVGGGKVYLTVDSAALRAHEDYVEVRYQNPPESWAPAAGFMYPAQATLWPTGSYYPEDASVTVHTPAGTVGLTKGMSVETSDGHKVGSIEGLDEDQQSGTVTDLIVKQGHLFSHDVRLPRDIVREIHEDRVTLTLTKDELANQYGD